jgi:hypothetical protein
MNSEGLLYNPIIKDRKSIKKIALNLTKWDIVVTMKFLILLDLSFHRKLLNLHAKKMRVENVTYKSF